jgi:hypothetical protein
MASLLTLHLWHLCLSLLTLHTCSPISKHLEREDILKIMTPFSRLVVTRVLGGKDVNKIESNIKYVCMAYEGLNKVNLRRLAYTEPVDNETTEDR